MEVNQTVDVPVQYQVLVRIIEEVEGGKYVDSMDRKLGDCWHIVRNCIGRWAGGWKIEVESWSLGDGVGRDPLGLMCSNSGCKTLCVGSRLNFREVAGGPGDLNHV